MIFRMVRLCFVWVFLGSAAVAADLTFTFDNEFSEDVAVEFYSMDRDHVWPGNGEVWILGVSDGEVSYPLSCQAGELICFGAWTVENTNSWGMGLDAQFDCTDCCAQCGSILPDTIILH